MTKVTVKQLLSLSLFSNATTEDNISSSYRALKCCSENVHTVVTYSLLNVIAAAEIAYVIRIKRLDKF